MDSEELNLIKLRRMIGDTSEPYQFSDEELKARLIDGHNNLNAIASEIWLEKASSINITEHTNSYRVGAESYSYGSAKDAYDYAMKMYDFYRSKLSPARLVRVVPGNSHSCDRRGYDLSRLTQDHQGW